MKVTAKWVRRFVLVMAVALAFTTPAMSAAQIVKTFAFRRVGPRVVAVPAYAVRPSYIYGAVALQRLANLREFWTVALQTRNGVVTRSYFVDDSGQAIQRARQEFPYASLIGVRKGYR